MSNSDDFPKITQKEQLILSLLISKGNKEQFGLELVNTSQGQLKKGTVYVLLQRLEEKGFIKSRKEKQQEGARGLPKRLYTISAEGKHALDQVISRLTLPAANYALGGV